jgi:hypothetical protein
MIFDNFKYYICKIRVGGKERICVKIIVGLTDDPALNKWAKVRTLNSCKRNRVKSDTVIGYPL